MPENVGQGVRWVPTLYDGNALMVVLPAPPQRGNARGHSRTLNFAKKKYFIECDAAARGLNYKDLPIRVAEFDAWVDVHQTYDWDNLCALFKWPMDWLVERGILLSDDWNHLRPRHFPKQRIIRAKKRDLMIVLFRKAGA